MSKPAKKSARERLVACPFCGSSSARVGHRLGGWPGVQCDKCGTIVPAKYATEQSAVETWNTRAAILKRSAAPKAHGPRAAKRGGR